MASELYNVIDALSREKGINPEIVVSAVEDAIVVATRKYYKTQENLRAVLDKDTGQIRAYAVKQIVADEDQIEDPNAQITLEEAQAIGADLIVMSSHRPAMRTYFLGSNAGHVVRYAKCSVLVVRN